MIVMVIVRNRPNLCMCFRCPMSNGVGTLVFWCFDILVFWCFDVLVFWCFDNLVFWYFGSIVGFFSVFGILGLGFGYFGYFGNLGFQFLLLGSTLSTPGPRLPSDLLSSISVSGCKYREILLVHQFLFQNHPT